VISLYIAPTVLEVCGLRPPEEMLDFHLVRDAGLGALKKSRIYGEVFTHEAVDLDRPERSLLYRWCIEGWHKLILPQERNAPPELYDLAKDPGETNNIAPGEPGRVRYLRKQINRWWTPGE
jgi:uncharacterized sulfatase